MDILIPDIAITEEVVRSVIVSLFRATSTAST